MLPFPPVLITIIRGPEVGRGEDLEKQKTRIFLILKKKKQENFDLEKKNKKIDLVNKIV